MSDDLVELRCMLKANMSLLNEFSKIEYNSIKKNNTLFKKLLFHSDNYKYIFLIFTSKALSIKFIYICARRSY